MELLNGMENLAKAAVVVVPFILLFCLFDEVKRENYKKRYVAIYTVMIIASIIFYRSL